MALHFRSLVTSAVLALLSMQLGCSAAPNYDATTDPSLSISSAESAATIHFDADWTETVAGTLKSGGAFAIDYEATRLPNCRASHNGNPGWQITAYARFSPSGEITEANLFDYAQTETGPDYHTWIAQTPAVQIPAGTTGLEMWFKNGSGFDHPCTEWDSNYQQNYYFPVSSSSAATGSFIFQSDWRNVQDGTIARGGELTIRYAPARMESIAKNATLNGMPYFASKYHCYGYGCCSHEYDMRAHVRFQPSGDFAAYPLEGDTASLSIPADASRVEVYFAAEVSTTTWYCGGAEGQKYLQPTTDSFYDSNYGNNFVYSIP